MADLDCIAQDGARFIEESFKIWCQKDYKNYFLDEFRCFRLYVPADGTVMSDWQLVFARRSDENFFFTVFMKNNKVESTGLDALIA